MGAATAARAALAAREGGPSVAVVSRCDEGADGARILFFDDGATRGSLGAPALDAAAARLGAELLADPEAPARTATVEGAPDVLLYGEAHHRPARLFVVGAGHIAVPLARLGVLLGFPVVVLDDRDEMATEDRFPEASDVRRVDFRDPFAGLAPARSDLVVLVTRAHRYDYDCLVRLVDTTTTPRYIGMVGSRRRVRAAFRALLDAGIPPERLAAIHAPIGVAIGAETPEEIAVSIAAELVSARRGVTAGGSLRDRERVAERLERAESSETRETPEQ